MLHYFRGVNLDLETAPQKQILFISSLFAYLEAPLNLFLCGSKHGVRGLFRSLRWEGPELGVPSLQVSLIAPTLVKISMTKDIWVYLQDVRGSAMSASAEIVDVGLRFLCDFSVEGRAVAVFPGSGPLDLCDDFEGAGRGT
jgi:5'-hydroxyaverantin dehydrogenase